MKKRALALVCALCMAAALLPPLPARAAVNGSDAQAYLDILDRTETDSSYLIDFDGDGRDELVTCLAVASDYALAHCNVYRGSQAVVTGMEISFEGTLDVYTKDGKSYLCRDNGFESSWREFSTLENGVWTDVGTIGLLYNTDDSVPFDEIFYYVNDNRVTEAEHDKALRAYTLQRTLVNYDGIAAGDVRDQLQTIVYSNRTPEEVLAQIPYLGDKSKCKMTPAQAEAFAQVLENSPRAIAEKSEWNDFENDKWMRCDQVTAYIGDIAGDGVPALLIDQDWVNTEYAGYDSVENIYLWQNGQAKGTKTITMYRSYGTAASEVFTSRGPNKFGGYSWNSWSREMAGAWQYNHFSWLENGAWKESTCTFLWSDANFYNSEFNYDDYTSVVLLNDVKMKTFSAEESEKAFKYVDQVIYDAGGPKLQYDGTGSDSSADPKPGAVSPASLAALLRAYAKARRFPSYSYPLLDAAESIYNRILEAAGLPQATEVRQLADGLYYAVYESGDGYAGVLVRQVRENGKAVFRLERADTEPVEQTELEPVASEALTKANLELDFSRITRRTSVEELRTYLSNLLANLNAPTPNDPAKSDLAAFLDSAVSTLSTQGITGKKNRFAPDSEAVAGLAAQAREVYDGLMGVLKENEVVLNKDITPTVRAFWSNIDPEKPCQIDLDRLAARALDGCDLQVLLGDAATYLSVTAEDLAQLTRELNGTLRIQFSQEEAGKYAIRFLDGDDQVVEQLSVPITVSLPASGQLDTIMASYAGGSDNWGGQYDPATGALSFEARYSGTYEVLENNVDIDDIEELSQESRTAISFMVSKGYLSAEDGLFRPGESLTRYEFTEALVGMFFALDRELTCDFPDVDEDSPYYPYVASAQAKSIVNGYDNGTFSGEDPINREQVFALAARTLMDQKGYTQPAAAEQYLSSFGDRDALSGWAAPQVALAVREGIAGRGAVLLPQANITREQAAVVLYRLFQLLYDVAPVALDLPGGAGGGLPLPAIIGIAAGAVAVIGGGAAGTVIALRRKKKKETPVA